MRISSIIVSSLLVGAAGVLAGTLFAPDKGSKTRGKIAKKGEEYKDYLLDNYDDIADSISRPFETLEDETRRLGKKANKKAKEIEAEVNQKLN